MYWNPYARGWVCPKCGGVMAPFMSVCAYCKPVAPAEPVFGCEMCQDYRADLNAEIEAHSMTINTLHRRDEEIVKLNAELASYRTMLKQTCQCSMRTKLVGDGCAICNPELAKELIQSSTNEE